MKTKTKEIYLTPVTEVYELLSEGIMTTSDQNGSGEGYGGWEL